MYLLGVLCSVYIYNIINIKVRVLAKLRSCGPNNIIRPDVLANNTKVWYVDDMT